MTDTTGTRAPPSTTDGVGRLRGLLAATRPRQWIKNLLVLAVPAAAGRLPEPRIALLSLTVAGCFVLVSAAVYLLNDVADRVEDAAHPVKRTRPIAAGVVPPPLALAAALLLVALGLGIAGLVTTTAAVVVLGLYLGLNVAYDLGLRKVPLLDVTVVAAGFVLRAVAGGAATGIAVSKWFLIVTSFGALYVVICKRSAELRDLGGTARESRARSVLDLYSVSVLRDLRVSTAAVAVTAYVLWAFENARFVDQASVFFELSIVPFVLALFRYAMVADAGGGAAPEEVLLDDRLLQLFSVAWLACFGAGVHVG